VEGNTGQSREEDKDMEGIKERKKEVRDGDNEGNYFKLNFDFLFQ
jgi:hypothetical protein